MNKGSSEKKVSMMAAERVGLNGGSKGVNGRATMKSGAGSNGGSKSNAAAGVNGRTTSKKKSATSNGSNGGSKERFDPDKLKKRAAVSASLNGIALKKSKAVVAMTMMMLAATASVEMVTASTATVRRREKSGKNGGGKAGGKSGGKAGGKSGGKAGGVSPPTIRPITPPTIRPITPPTPPPGQYYKKNPRKNSKKKPTTSLPVDPPTEFPTEKPITDEPTDPTKVPVNPTPAPVSPTTAPTEVLLDIPNTAEEAGYTTFVAALTAANLVDELSFPGESFTVMAPTNAAFCLLDEGMLECLFEPRYVETLEDLLRYHVDSSKEVLAQNGCEFGVVKQNLIASNGIMNGIDRVCIPPGT